MAANCEYTYNGKKYSEKEFKAVLLDGVYDKEILGKEIDLSASSKKDVTKSIEPLLNKGALMGITNTEDALKYISQQAQNISDKGEDLSGTANAKESAVRAFGKDVVDAAIERYPKESFSPKEKSTLAADDVLQKSQFEFRPQSEVDKILSQELPEGKRNDRVEITDIYGDKTSLKRARDVQRGLQKDHRLLDLLIKCLTA